MVGGIGGEATAVPGGDAVAVGVLDVVQRAIGVERLDLAVGLLQAERPAGTGVEEAVFPRLVEIAAAGCCLRWE